MVLYTIKKRTNQHIISTDQIYYYWYLLYRVAVTFTKRAVTAISCLTSYSIFSQICVRFLYLLVNLVRLDVCFKTTNGFNRSPSGTFYISFRVCRVYLNMTTTTTGISCLTSYSRSRSSCISYTITVFILFITGSYWYK